MQISCSIVLQEHDTFDMSTSEVSDAIFAALGADENLDYCAVYVTPVSPPKGETGTPPPPPQPAEAP